MDDNGLKYLLIAIGVKKEDIETEIEKLHYPLMHDEEAGLKITNLLVDWYIYANSHAGRTIAYPAPFILSRARTLRKPPLDKVTADEGYDLVKTLMSNFIQALPQEEIESLEQDSQVFRSS